MSISRFIYAAAICVFSVNAFCQDVELTVYNQNMGLVKEKRSLDMEKGIKKVDFTEVAAQIDPTSVRFKSLSAPESCSVLEQNFEYDLVSRDKLLQKYIGREIELERRSGENGEKKEIIKGTLLSIAGGITLKVDDKILLNPSGEIALSKLPEGLVTKPTLSWLVENERSGRQNVEIDYITNGINWSADYVVVSDKDDKMADLTGWVTIDNRSGATYRDAKLKLIAGDVNRVSAGGYKDVSMVNGYEMMRAKAAVPQFQEKSFFEYHMYTLQRRATVNDNETKQVEFTKAMSVPVKKIYTYDGSRMPFYGYQDWYRTNKTFGTETGSKKVSVMLEFKNSKENNLGMPLPKGRIRVYKEDSDGSLEFVGEDSIDHTPKDEQVRVYLGDAFDIVGERTQADFKCGTDWCEESFKITLRNHKDEQVEVRVIEHLYRWSNWKITEKSMAYEKKDSRTAEFKAVIPKDGESVITYTVKYWW
ncbi:MAG: hypothetical protein A2297_00590 [Elusimicrobia bacterium RIFOXYB2_FULL_48_7]|nr:MAG: hypothetical protein A2297_00590 [Elusimicrobia bacterium RIFOXYB2_FULL_48_7]